MCAFTQHKCPGWAKVVGAIALGITKRYQNKAAYIGCVMTIGTAMIHVSSPIRNRNAVPSEEKGVIKLVGVRQTQKNPCPIRDPQRKRSAAVKKNDAQKACPVLKANDDHTANDGVPQKPVDALVPEALPHAAETNESSGRAGGSNANSCPEAALRRSQGR